MNQDIFIRILGDRWLRLAVLLVLLAALAQQLALAFWQLYPLPESARVTPSGPILRADDTARVGADFQQQASAIGRAFLFGQPEVAQVVEVQVEEAPETQLNYKLRGIYYSLEPRLSLAIVEVKPNETRVYMIDDELADNITLSSVEEDHILLNRYGKLERLNLQKPLPSNQRAASSRAVGGVGNVQQTALLRSYKKRYASNPMALATRFQAIPVQQDGKNIGFKLKALRGESLLRRLNFEADDVFTSVNGVSLQNPFEALDALKSLTTSQSVSVSFMRNGTELTQDFEL